MCDQAYLYYNLILFNDTGRNIPATITPLALQTPLMNKPDDYIVSVLRFGVYSKFPLFFPTIPDPTHPTVTDISITLGYNGNFYQQFVQVTEDEAKNGIFSIGPFLYELNTASAAAWTAMTKDNPGAPGQSPPYFALNPDTQIVSMYVDIGWLEAPNTNLIFFNQQLQSILNLPASNYKQPPVPFGIDYQIRVLGYSKVLPPVDTRFNFPYALNGLNLTILQVEQEYAQTNNFLGLDRILLTSTTIPTVTESTPVNTTQAQSSTTQSSFLSILTDLSIANLDHNFNYIEFLPTAEFRRIALRRSKPINELDIAIQYTTFDDEIHPLVLPPGGSMSVKLMFERRF
jgi:hypothetical protein